LFFSLFPARPLLNVCSSVPNGVQKVAHASFAITGLTLPRRCVRNGVVDALGLAPSVAPWLCSTACTLGGYAEFTFAVLLVVYVEDPQVRPTLPGIQIDQNDIN
jgi:hypothetical protein